MATGYLPDGTVAPLADLGWIGPAGQMYSTTDDLNKVNHDTIRVSSKEGGAGEASPPPPPN